MKSALVKLLEAITPIFIQQLLKTAAGSIGGFQLFIAKMLIKYGGKQLAAYLKDLHAFVERAEKQAEAKKELDTIKSNPNTTPEQLGEAYERFYNSGRTKPINSDNRSVINRL